MKTQNQWLFELPPINQQLEPDFSEGRRSSNQQRFRDPQKGWIEPIPRHQPRGDDGPLLDPRIPGEKPKEKGGAVIGNQSFRTGSEARQAAKQAARQLDKQRGTGHTIIPEDPSKPGEQPHYHVIGPDGKRASGHFYYGHRKARFIDHAKPRPSRKTHRGKTHKEFEISFEALPTSNLGISPTSWRSSAGWLFEAPSSTPYS